MASALLAFIYLSFISLGLPDSVLGAAWPVMYPQLGVPVSAAGILAMIISLGTIVSSLQSDRLTRWLGAGKVTAISVAMTAAALWGFSCSDGYWQLCLWAIPYGLGAGSVDAALNNYVALHYSSRHMSWLHCCWGIGATLGPYMMSFAIARQLNWPGGYRIIGSLQILLSILLVLSLPLWKKPQPAQAGEAGAKSLSLKEVLAVPGAAEVMLCFFCYCALEQTAALWGGSYLALNRGFAAEAATGFGSLFFIGITVGRALSGLAASRLGDTGMVRLGFVGIALGIGAVLLPVGPVGALAGLVLIGLGCAPIYPSIIHSTPANFGEDKSQAVIGVQMAAAYVGTLTMPPLFGVISQHTSIALMPLYLLALLACMALLHRRYIARTQSGR